LTLEPTIASLKKVWLFAELPEDPLRLIAFGAERITRRRGQRLFTEGAPAFTAYLVLEGSIELRAAHGELGTAPVVVAGPGDLIGELALLCETARPATAVVLETGVLLEIPRLVMRRVLDEYPPVASILHAAYAERLGAMMSEFEAVRSALITIGKGGPAR